LGDEFVDLAEPCRAQRERDIAGPGLGALQRQMKRREPTTWTLLVCVLPSTCRMS
jgi:hypothetical protein